MLKGGDSTTSPIYRFFQEYSSCYPLPIKANVNTARDVPEKTKSFLVDRKDKRSRVILDLFAEIIGGDYKMTRGRMKFIPKANQDKRLDMVLSASSIRALMHMAVYLYFQAKVGDILIIDEPEVNLHPEWQVKFAEILVLIASELNVSLYINTHSPMFIEAITLYSEFYDLLDETNVYLTEEEFFVQEKESGSPERRKVYLVDETDTAWVFAL